MKSQNDQILSWLKKGRVINPKLALQKFGTMRLAARICDLRQAGNVIYSDWLYITKETKVKAYYMTGVK